MAAATSPPAKPSRSPRSAARPLAIDGGPLPPQETARYVAEFTLELSALAKRARLDLLSYLLDMAHIEASRAEEEAGR